MSKCRRCRRELKNHTESGMGKICRMKANQQNGTVKTTLRVEPLYTGHPARRSYIVFGESRRLVVVTEDGTDRFANCPCSIEMCEHRQAVAEFDRTRFPENIFTAPAPTAVEPESDGAVEPAPKGFVNVSERKVIAAIERVIGQEYSCEVTKTDVGKYRVLSHTSGNFYHISLNRGIFGVTAHCSCPDFEFNRLQKDEVCKHISAVYHFERRSQIIDLNEFNVPSFAAAA